ncbi:hypothetical protein [Estrella lausannensis]|uniref:Conserved putative secreted protein n=1 Tax=Estrella lausannensis TaxID=483423 RepID=A0A0H5DPD6_9BACT|nr:hypothetical protein [Estrella lausannensis]CRX37828.1 Conserved putative secreted protein [Estrella lausannensis]
MRIYRNHLVACLESERRGMACFSFNALVRLFSFTLIAFLSNSCGYQMGTGETVSPYKTLQIPLVKGDIDGSLTQEVVKELAQRGCAISQTSSCGLILHINLLEIRDEDIGFRYDRNKKGELTHSIVPVETRVFAKAEVSLEDGRQGCTLLGPVRIEAWHDYDNDYYYSQNGVNVFSLGELSDYETSKEAAKRPLYRALSRKIADYVLVSW